MLIYLVLAVFLLILLTVLLLWYVVRLARKRALAQPAAAAHEAQRRSLASLRWSFSSAITHIEATLASRWRRYRIPWIMLLGEAGSGKSTLIECSGIDRALNVATGAVQHVGVSWNYFNRGVVLDVAGEYLRPAAGGDDQSWQTLLRLTEKYRHQRPVDGVVVTLCASDLLAAMRSSAEELVHKGDLMHRRLWQAQNRFGIRFPVYVVVTQCDRIAGFSSFARTLPQRLRDDMLGWSNPYDFEAGYQSDWVGHAVDSIVQDIFAIQAELLAAGRAADDLDAFVLFPSALSALREGLRAYLDQLFRPSAYHETFYFRGIYLTGDAGPAAQAESSIEAASSAERARSPVEPAQIEPAMLPSGPARETVFVKDLLERKVFAEFGLARPSREALATRSRTVRVLRWSTAIVGLGWFGTLVLATFQLDSKVTAYRNALEVMVNATTERAAAHSRKVNLPVDWYLKNTNLLLERMAPLGDVRLWWFSIPGSWPGVTSLHNEIQSVLFRGFEDIVFALARKGLNRKISELTGLHSHPITTELQEVGECTPQRTRDQGEAPIATIAIEDLPEFARLREQVQGMRMLEANLGTFAEIQKGEGEMPDLRALLRYTWRIELPETLDKRGYQTAALRQRFKYKEKNPGEVFPKVASCAIGQRLDRIYSQFFAQSPVLTLSQSIGSRISNLGEPQRSGVREGEPYVELLRQIETLDRLLKNPRAQWLVRGEQGLGAVFDDLQNQIRGAVALGPQVSDQARRKAQAEIEALRKNIARAEAEGVGAIVSRAPEGAWVLAPNLSSFEAALAMLFKQRFMLDAEIRALEVRIDPGTLVRWDVKRLDEAIALAEEQRRYLKDNLAKFPGLLQEDIREISDRQLARRMTELVAKAESIVADAPKTREGVFGTEASLNTHDFDRAGPQLVRILAILKEVGADSTYDGLASLMKQEAMRGLRGINRALDVGELYAVRDGNFSWWQGTKNPAASAFRVTDSQGLAELLSQQYGQVEWLAKLSVPLLAVVDSSGLPLDADDVRVVRRLRAITREVDRFKNKNPKNAVADLEAFIGKEMPEIDRRNCLDKLAPGRGSIRDANFFLERQILLRQQLYVRCVELVTEEATKAYATIQESFDRTIAGRFPFSQLPERGLGGEADPDDVVQFLRVYERHAKSVLPLLRTRIPLKDLANAGKFLDQMDRVRAFLGPLVPADDGASPAGYDLAIEFRVNQRAEIDGNKIVDWSLEAGDRTVSLRDANRQLRWRPGMPIVLTLRWAKDAPTAPVNDGALRHLSVEGKNVVFRFADPWALVSMLKMHAAGPVDAVSRSEVRPHTLKFEFATQPVPAAGQYRSNLPESRARVFIRVTVTPGGKKDILSLPVFPFQAPRISPDSGPQKLGAGATWPEARSGWADASGPGMHTKTSPAQPPSNTGVRRGTGESRE